MFHASSLDGMLNEDLFFVCQIKIHDSINVFKWVPNASAILTFNIYSPYLIIDFSKLLIIG
jgi:hypothetical protein